MCANIHAFNRIHVYKFNCGTTIGNEFFIWKVYPNIDQRKQCDTVAEVRAMVLKFERYFFAKEVRRYYVKVRGLTLIVQRSLLQYLIGKISQ